MSTHSSVSTRSERSAAAVRILTELVQNQDEQLGAFLTQQQQQILERKKFLDRLTEVFEERSQKDSDSGESDVEGLSLGIFSQHKPNLRDLGDKFTKVSQFDGNDTLYKNSILCLLLRLLI